VNPNSWTAHANVIWVDQPAGVGFSYGDGDVDHDEKGVSEDMYWFVQEFLAAHPTLADNDFCKFHSLLTLRTYTHSTHRYHRHVLCIVFGVRVFTRRPVPSAVE
jgi:hypothetical protein